MSAIIESSKVKEIQRLGDTPMWVVFWTTTIPSEIDEYKVVPSEQEAIKLYKELLEKSNLYCAGYAPVARGTEPHWTDGGQPC